VITTRSAETRDTAEGRVTITRNVQIMYMCGMVYGLGQSSLDNDRRTGDKAVGRKQTGTTAARLFIETNQRVSLASGVRGDKAGKQTQNRGPIESALNTLTWKGSTGRQIEAQMEFVVL